MSEPAPVHAVEIDRFANGRKLLMRVTAPGSYRALGKEGKVYMTYQAGNLMLCDAAGRVIVSPMGPEGAADLAGRVLDGDERALTDSAAIYALAIAVIGFIKNERTAP